MRGCLRQGFKNVSLGNVLSASAPTEKITFLTPEVAIPAAALVNYHASGRSAWTLTVLGGAGRRAVQAVAWEELRGAGGDPRAARTRVSPVCAGHDGSRRAKGSDQRELWACRSGKLLREGETEAGGLNFSINDVR